MTKPHRVLVTFDTHTPYLAFRVSAIQRELERCGLSESVRLEVVLTAFQEASYGWSGGDLRGLYGGVPVRVLSDAPFRGLGLRTILKFNTLKTCLKMARAIVGIRPKIAFVGGYDRPECIVALALSKILRFKIGPLHDSRFNDAESFAKNIRLESFKSIVMRRYDFFMCSGKECVEYSKFLGGVHKPAFRAGWNVVDNAGIAAAADDDHEDLEIYRHLQLDPGDRFILMPIRFIPKKNVGPVLRAYAASAGERGDAMVKLAICGQGPLETEMRAEVAANGLEEQVKIVGWLPYSQVPRACRLSEAVVLASTHDQWGLIVNEALAAGAPVLVSNRCGSHELVQNYVNGFTFSPEHIDHLAELFGFLSDDRELVQRLQGNARESVARFSEREFLEVVWEVLRRYKVIGGDHSLAETEEVAVAS